MEEFRSRRCWIDQSKTVSVTIQSSLKHSFTRLREILTGEGRPDDRKYLMIMFIVSSLLFSRFNRYGGIDRMKFSWIIFLFEYFSSVKCLMVLHWIPKVISIMLHLLDRSNVAKKTNKTKSSQSETLCFLLLFPYSSHTHFFIALI